MVQKELLIYPTSMFPEEFNSAFNSALGLYASSYFAISHRDNVDIVQIRYARSLATISLCVMGNPPANAQVVL